MGGGEGRVEHRRRLGRFGGHVVAVHVVGPFDELGARHDRVDPGVQQRGMHLKAHEVRVKANAALVASHRLHGRRLAHDHRRALGHHALHRLDHRRGTGAADLFVKAERDL